MNQLRNWHNRPFFMSKIVYYRVEHKNPLNFMKFNRKEYDLIYDAFQYMDFKMTKDQRRLAEHILDSAFYPEVLQEVKR